MIHNFAAWRYSSRSHASMNVAGLVAGLCLFVVACSPGKDDAPERAVLATIGRAEKLTLFEGLPHPMYEAKQLDSEKKSKPTIELDGFHFYKEPLDLKGDDARMLGDLLGRSDTFEPFLGEKKCGGFHPDYAVEWTAGGTVYRYLVCFGCGEVKVHGSDGDSRFNIAIEARKRLETILKPYRENRPEQSGSPF
jgi:hypothetical protein